MSDLFSPSVFGRPRAIDDPSEAEAYMQARLQALMIDARMHRDIAGRSDDAIGAADWQRNVDWLGGALADHQRNIYRERVIAEKMAELPCTATGRSLSDELWDEATATAAERHHAEQSAEAASTDDGQRLDAMEARIRRLERDDRAERLASQALAIVERRR